MSAQLHEEDIKFDEVPCLVWWKERVKVYKDGYGYGTVFQSHALCTHNEPQ